MFQGCQEIEMGVSKGVYRYDQWLRKMDLGHNNDSTIKFWQDCAIDCN